MICKAGLADHSKLAKQTLGTGPWVLSEVAAEDHYSYTKRDGLRLGAGRPDRHRARIAGLGQRPDHRQPDHRGQPAAVRRGQHGHRHRQVTPSGWTRPNLVSVNVAAPTGETWFNQADGPPRVRRQGAAGAGHRHQPGGHPEGGHRRQGRRLPGHGHPHPEALCTDTVTGQPAGVRRRQGQAAARRGRLGARRRRHPGQGRQATGDDVPVPADRRRRPHRRRRAAGRAVEGTRRAAEPEDHHLDPAQRDRVRQRGLGRGVDLASR